MKRRARDRSRGAAAVEFALVLPLLLTLVLGTIDWGWYFFVDQVVTNAAREGARAGTLVAPAGTAPAYSNGDAAENAATSAAEAYLDQLNLKDASRRVLLDTPVLDGTRAVEVQIIYPVGSITQFLTGLVPDNATATAVMRWQ